MFQSAVTYCSTFHMHLRKPKVVFLHLTLKRDDQAWDVASIARVREGESVSGRNWECLHGDTHTHTQVFWPWFTIHIQGYSHWLLDQASWVNILFMIQFRVLTEFTKTCRSSDRTGSLCKKFFCSVHFGERKWSFSSAACCIIRWRLAMQGVIWKAQNEPEILKWEQH